MKKNSFIPAAILAATLCGWLTGCLLKPATISTRSFVLSPMAEATTIAPPNGAHPALGIGRIQMPAYLLRPTMVVRKGTNEIEYLENALWAERLDRAFQRTFAANMKRLVPADEIRLTDWLPADVDFAVQVTVEEFDVDAAGQARLVAWWRILNPTSRTVLRRGESRLEAGTTSPERDPQAAVTALNELLEKFSGKVAQAVRECSTDAKPQ
jgi:uncharacterized lipoprotein YmbA